MNEDSKPASEPGGGSKEEGISALDRRVAGIDVGSKAHWVCAPAREGEGREVQAFGATTPELEKMVEWLLERGVESVALESTGVYWIPVHEVLESRGLEVPLVDTRSIARVPGRTKTDRRDCEWIQRLHSCGLLPGAFRPPEQICRLRTLVRDKGNRVAEQGDGVRRMQKSLEQMNVRVHRAVADLTGATGMALVRAIVRGEREVRPLAKLRDPRCHKSKEEIAEQLTGPWREDHSLQPGASPKDVRGHPGEDSGLRAGHIGQAQGNGAGRRPGERATGVEEQGESPSDPQAWTRAAPPSVVPSERRGSDLD